MSLDIQAQQIVDRIKKEIRASSFDTVRGIVETTGYASGKGTNVIRVGKARLQNVPCIGEVHLIPGMAVTLLRSRDAATSLVIGPASPDARPQQGVIQSVGSVTAVVRVTYSAGSTRDVSCPWATTVGGSAPPVGANVLLQWQGDNAVIVGVLSTSPPSTLEPPYVPDPPDDESGSKTTVFRANATGTLKNYGEVFESPEDWRWRTGDTPFAHFKQYFGATGALMRENFFGLWVYGNKVKSSLAGRTIEKAEFYVAAAGEGKDTHLAVINISKRTSSSVSWNTHGTSYPVVYPRSARKYIQLPEAWWPYLKNGYGIAARADANFKDAEFRPISKTAQSGALRITHRKS